MFMQAWGHYGTAWSVVHQSSACGRTSAAAGCEIDAARAGRPAELQGSDIRLGDGSVDVHGVAHGQPLHDDDRRAAGVPGISTLLLGAHAAGGAPRWRA